MGRQAAGGAAAKVARPGPAPADVVRGFTRGTEWPRGVVWFGVRSFWGHLRHLIAAAIATENIDCRDWMSPDEPRELLARIARAARRRSRRPPASPTALGRDVYVDFVADTGDDMAVSRAVARAGVRAPTSSRSGSAGRGPDRAARRHPLLRRRHRLPGRDRQGDHQPGDRALEQVLEALPTTTGGRRVLLGIPGNHDWYDGLDGFARMFRRRAAGRGSRARAWPPSARLVIEHYAEWATRVRCAAAPSTSPRRWRSSGYTPVQSASLLRAPPRARHRPGGGRSPAHGHRFAPARFLGDAPARAPGVGHPGRAPRSRLSVRRAEPGGRQDGRDPAPRPRGGARPSS